MRAAWWKLLDVWDVIAHDRDVTPLVWIVLALLIVVIA